MKCAPSIERNAENQDWFPGFSQSKAETHSDNETVRGGVFAALSPIFLEPYSDHVRRVLAVYQEESRCVLIPGVGDERMGLVALVLKAECPSIGSCVFDAQQSMGVVFV